MSVYVFITETLGRVTVGNYIARVLFFDLKEFLPADLNDSNIVVVAVRLPVPGVVLFFAQAGPVPIPKAYLARNHS